MRQYELKVTSQYTLKGYIFDNVESPKGVIVICHGMAEHIERYFDYCTFLEKNNFIVFGYNQRGHGSTAGSVDNVGYMDDKDNFVALVSDLDKNIDYVRKLYPTLPVYLLGHSMGSFVSQRYIELYANKIKGVVLCGSSLQKGLLFSAGRVVANLITLFKGRRGRSKLLDSLSFGSYNKAFKPNRTKFDWLSKNEENVDNYINDEFCGNLFTCSFFKDMLHMFKIVNKNFDKIKKDLPILIISGEKDPVSNACKNAYKLCDVYKKNGIGDTQIIVYKDLRHEILNEENREIVFKDTLDFFQKA